MTDALYAASVITRHAGYKTLPVVPLNPGKFRIAKCDIKIRGDRPCAVYNKRAIPLLENGTTVRLLQQLLRESTSCRPVISAKNTDENRQLGNRLVGVR